MPVIKSIQQLVNTLNQCEDHSYAEVLADPALDDLDWDPLASWDQPYTRNCVARTDEYELILLCWNPRAESLIHDHGGQKCWVRQVSGKVEEVRYELHENGMNISNHEVLGPGETTFMDDEMGVHKIGNPTDEKSMTLHLYATPIDECKCYDDQGKVIETAVMSYDTIHDLSEVETG